MIPESSPRANSSFELGGYTFCELLPFARLNWIQQVPLVSTTTWASKSDGLSAAGGNGFSEARSCCGLSAPAATLGSAALAMAVAVAVLAVHVTGAVVAAAFTGWSVADVESMPHCINNTMPMMPTVAMPYKKALFDFAW